jgi:hypothetical protein
MPTEPAKPKRRRPVKTTLSTTCRKCNTFFTCTYKDGVCVARWTKCRCGETLLWPEYKR